MTLNRYWARAAILAVASLAGCGKPAEVKPPRAEIEIPSDQATLLGIVTAAQSEASQAENDMQLGGVKSSRDKALCEALSSLSASYWIGRIDSISSNSDGKGVLAIEIAKGVLVKTWNNAVSDMLSDTLIEPGSQVFETASRMKPGQRVIFSGRFFQGTDGDCLGESSLTLRGKVKEPEFIFRFSELRDYETTRTAWEAEQIKRKAATSAAAPTPPQPQPSLATAPTAALDTASNSGSPAIAPVAPSSATGQAGSAPGVVAAREADPPSQPPGDAPLMRCATTRHEIVIDRDTSSRLVRYRAWNRPKPQSEPPDMEVQPGEIIAGGTGTCRSTRYRFERGDTVYNVDNSVACLEERPPENAVGQLQVLIRGEVKASYWCLQ